jgi:hypothetical protein
MTDMDILRCVNDVWPLVRGTQREELRRWSLNYLGHAPDPALTYDEIVASMETVVTPRERGSAMQLGCNRWCGTCMPVPGSVMTDERRRVLIQRILSGSSNRREEKELKDSMLFQSETLRIRTRVVPKIAIKWLRGRRDLMKFVPNLIGVAGMGAGVFCSYVANLVLSAEKGLHDLLAEKKCLTCCIKCALESQKQFKVNVRYGCIDRPELDGLIFDWQYSTHLLGRFDHVAFADKEDLQQRIDYDANLPVRNGVSHLRARFDELYEKELKQEGERFGYICAQAVITSGQPYHHLAEMALTKVPCGSIGANGVNELAAQEIEKMHLNKKLAIIYLTKGEEEALKFAECNARSGWLWKLEIGKLRNLIPGSLGYYLSSARASAYGEGRFLGTMENVPLMWSEARKEKVNSEFAGWQSLGYVACRDYKNYNICHKHERMQMFYAEAARMSRFLGVSDLAEDFDHMQRCLDDVGVYVDDVYNKWEYGLQTGWAHTMMFHCVHNSCAGRVVAKMVQELTGWKRYVASHQGDDSREVWSDVMAGPLAQAILDASGQVGQAEKQHFATETGSWAEFLRVWYKQGVTRGSALRVIGGLVSSDGQHSPHEGGVEMVKTICETLNDVWRRQGGKLGMRVSDVATLMDYWSTSNEEFRLRGSVNWRGMLSERFGLALAAFPELQWRAIGGTVDRRKRYKVEAGPYMLKRARRNLLAVGRVLDIGRYAAEYAKDMIASGVETSVDIKDVVVEPDVACGSHDNEIKETPHLLAGAREVVRRCLEGKMGWQDKDEFSVQVTVNHLFAGSETVARKYVKEHVHINLTGAPALRENLERGLGLLAGKTSMDRKLLSQNLVCAKKYWPHVETYLRDRVYYSAIQRWLGYLVAYEAIRCGEWI